MATSAVMGRALAALAVAALAACAQVNRAPVEDRTRMPVYAGSSPAVSAPDSGGAAQPGAENAGRPGYYTIRAGDTLIRIGLETGQSWKDLARWNRLENPDVIEVGQVIRVVPPVGEHVASFTPNMAPNTPADAGVEVTPVDSRRVQPLASAPPAAATPPAAKPPPAASGGKTAFVWPAQGSLLAGFGQANNNGIDIGGKAGDAVLATAAGKVVYAGSDLRGYGNLIILQHNETYLSIYAHNQKLLVKEDQIVKQGQKIAEMGSSDSDRVKLHFELRRQGNPVNPVPLLPAR